MSLRTKIVYILLAVIALYAAVDNGFWRVFIPRMSQRWEEDDAVQKLELVRSAIENERQNLLGKAKIWANYDRIFELVSGSGARDEEILERALTSSDVDLFFVCTAAGEARWSVVVDPETRAPISIKEALPKGGLSRNHALMNFRGVGPVEERQSHKSGLMMTDRAPLLIASHPITGADGLAFDPDVEALPEEERPRFRALRHGVVILGRFLAHDRAVAIDSQAKATVEILDPRTIEMTEGQQALIDGLTSGQAFVSEVGTDGRLHLYKHSDDLRTGEPLLQRVAIEREMTARGQQFIRFVLVSTVSASLMLLVVLLHLLRRIVVRPLSTLTKKAVEIGKTDDTSIRVGMDRADEIGQLSSEFDSMLSKLADSRAQVVKTARLAGMSQIATGVLHNVGNVLNSVNVSASMVAKKAEKLSVKDLEMMSGVLRKHEANIGDFVTRDPKGKHLLPFLFEVTDSLIVEKRALIEEMRSLTEGIEHIADLVRAQQNFAGTKGVFEFASLEDELESAVRFVSQASGPDSDVEIVREFEELPQVRVDKHKLMEILVNVIQNARQAMDEASSPSKRLTLRILRPDSGTARIEVSDNGPGVAPENLTRVFHHGFTTKKNGHGFGLHVSANAATEMNASLQVRSEGPGHGATFLLDIPIDCEELARAA